MTTHSPTGAGGDTAAPLHEIQVFRHPDEFPGDVRELLDAAQALSIEFGSAWYRNFVETLPEFRGEAYFHVLRRRGRCVAVLPVMTTQRGQVRSLGNYYTALYAPALDPTLASAELAVLIDAVRKAHAPMAALRLEPMDPSSQPYRTLLDALRQAGLYCFDFLCFGNWYLPVRQSWADYLAQRPGELRNTAKRMEKKLAKAGAVVEVVTGGPQLQRAIDAYVQVYNASWKRPEPHPEFMPGLIRTCAGEGWLRLGLVWLDGRPIAAQLWIVAHGKALIYKLAYDEAFKALGPGTVLTARLMQQALDQDRVREVDYLIGDDPYKKSWMSHRRERRGIVAYNPRTVRGALAAAQEAAARAIKPLRHALRRQHDTSAG